MIFSFIDIQRANHAIELMCRVLKVSRSGYHAWRVRPPSRREHEDAALTERIECIHRNSRGTYGAPRVHARLHSAGVRVGNKRVARLMRKAGLEGCYRRRKKTPRTTQREIQGPCSPPTSWSGGSRRRRQTSCGWPTSPMCRPGRALTIWPSCSTPTPEDSSGGRWPLISGRSLWRPLWEWLSGEEIPLRD